MRFISIPVLSLGRRPMRTVLTIIGIAVAVGSFIALVGMSRALEKAWVNSLTDRGTHLLVTRKGVVELLTASIKEHVGEELRQIEGVRAVAGELVDLVTLKSGQAVLITGWAPESYLWQTLHLVQGDLPDFSSSEEVMIGQACSESLGKEVGDTVSIRDNEFIVAGIFRESGVMTNGTIVFPLHVMQDMIEKPGTVTVFNLLIDHPDQPLKVDNLRKTLGEAFDELLFTETDQIAESNHIMRLFHAMAWGTSSIALVIALVVIVNTLLMTVSEQKRQIGILSAVGWSSARILAVVIVEGFLLALFGSVAGSVLGIYGLHYLASLPQMQGFLQPEITLRMVLEVCGATCVLGVFGGLYPAFRAIRINTVDALRYE